MTQPLRIRRQLSNRPLRGALGDWGYTPPPARPALGLHAHLRHLRQTHCPVRWTRWAVLRLAAYILVPALWVLAIALGVFSQARAADLPGTRLVATLGAYHPDRDYARERGLRDATPGLGIEHDVRRSVTLGAGYFRNSYARDSLYLVASWQPLTWRQLRGGVAGMLVTGYPIHGGGLFDAGLAAAAVLSWRPAAGVGGNLVITPKVADKTHGAIALQLTHATWGLR